MITLSDIRLNPDLDIPALAAQYARERFVQVPEIFDADSAEAISHHLRASIPWRLIYAHPDDGVIQLSPSDAAKLGPEELDRRMAEVLARATDSFGFCYHGYHMSQARREGRDGHHPIHKVTDLLNSPAFLRLAEQLIGETGLTRANAQATLYDKGNFLTRHIDDGAHHERRAAYTLSFCRDWKTDWGGLLQFIDPATGDVTSGWLPRFNTLTLFDGRRVHSVSPVSEFAGDGRYTVAGWLRNDPA